MNELVQILKNTRQHLMTGVSHMIPFVVSGGILLAVSVMLYGKGAVPDAVADPNLKKLFDIGVAGLTLMVPFLAAYIGYSIAERSALAPCAIGAWVGNSFGAGFFGALIAGIIGGIVVHYLKKIPVHKVLRSVMPIFIIPIVGTLITAGIMMWGLGEPVGALTNSLTQWLQGMQQGSIVMLAVIMGLMLAFDMGGPVNKVAYAFMLICVAQGVYTVVAIAAVGICVPPLGMGLATLIGRKNFSAEERETGKAALVMGCVGVTEGAIPFAAADPLRVIPSIMVGSVCGAVTAALVGAQCYAGWGGLIVLPVVEGSNICDIGHRDWAPVPLLSSFISDCLEKGRDITDGGARYNFSGVQGIGIANLSDSLHALKGMVFDQQRLSFDELLSVLKANFATPEGEKVRARLINRFEKYGNDIDEVDNISAELLRHYCKEVEKYQNPRGGYFTPGSYTVSAHVPLGSVVGATPDGRFAGEQLADGGLSPMLGQDAQGPTAVLKSVSKLDNTLLSNGTLLNVKFTPATLEGEAGLRKLADFLRAFTQLKLQHIQFNVVNADTLREAQQRPQDYAGLVVRVAGYSAFFVELSKEIQDDIIRRTAHQL
ncbi:PTS fructose transporter subunit EIIC [Escherichia coli]|nr:PTS fructose transporter subunit EIIC [Escherichia coli]EEW7614701.1 PTS fructose transporter subunit EIIC [Escherichia coli]EFB2754249.1 PTS fructose transporter subunit EIIC [Escherichia coli]EFB5730352.1 PTS fructose transporter subunit EIIC [Escherichia coli]EFN7844952.1 PTS fructose transporter subunit EIIC [Escherichia coli]